MDRRLLEWAEDWLRLSWGLRRATWLMLVAWGVSISADAAERDVYLLGGQSNMQGIARVADLPSDFPRALTNAFFWSGNEFEPLVLGTTKTSTREGEFGPEVGLAFKLATTVHPAFLIKYHASGMPLHHGWDGAEWVGGDPAPGRRNFYPGEGPEDPNQGTLYREMIAAFCAGLDALKRKGDQPVVRGFFWMQGEQDSKQEESAGVYAASLRRLRWRLGNDVGAQGDLPMVFGQVLPHEPARERFVARPLIRDQMAAADAGSCRSAAIPGVRMVSTDGFGLMPDTVHYDAAGQLRLGEGFAEAYGSLIRADHGLQPAGVEHRDVAAD